MGSFLALVEAQFVAIGVEQGKYFSKCSFYTQHMSIEIMATSVNFGFAYSAGRYSLQNVDLASSLADAFTALYCTLSISMFDAVSKNRYK